MRILTTFMITALVVASGCGDDDETSLSATTTADDDGMAMEESAEGDHETFAFGEPADAADADRTIEVNMFDDFRYEPPSIDVAVDETVTFRIANSGEIVHEFVIGDEGLQERHEEEMEEMEGDTMMADEPNGVAVEPGGTKSLTFRFAQQGQLQYACHQPGHYDAGMFAPLTVE